MFNPFKPLELIKGEVFTSMPQKFRNHLDDCAFGGPDLKTLYITEALSGDILAARMPVAGKKMFGLQ